MNAIVFDGHTLRLAVPDCDRAEASGFSKTLRIASRIKSATLRPDRAAALRSAASSSLRTTQQLATRSCNACLRAVQPAIMKPMSKMKLERILPK